MSSPGIMRTLQLFATPVVFCSPSPSPSPSVAMFRQEKNTEWSLLVCSLSGVYVWDVREGWFAHETACVV